MNEKYSRIGFHLTTGLLTVIVMMFIGNATFNREMFAHRFASLGCPTYIIYPLVAVKVLGCDRRNLHSWHPPGKDFY
jgi:hypothetical protein